MFSLLPEVSHHQLRPLDVPPVAALLQLAAFWQWLREEAAKLLVSIVLSNFQKKQALKDQKHLPPQKDVQTFPLIFHSASPKKNTLLHLRGLRLLGSSSAAGAGATACAEPTRSRAEREPSGTGSELGALSSIGALAALPKVTTRTSTTSTTRAMPQQRQQQQHQL